MKVSLRRARALALTAGLACLLAVAGCGGSPAAGGGDHPAAPGSRSSQGTAAPAPRLALLDSVQKTTAQSYQADITVTENIGGLGSPAATMLSLPMHIKAESSQREEATIATTVLGQKIDLVVIVYDGTAYISTDGGSTFQTQSGLASVGQYSPQSALQYLEAAGTVTDEGPATVDGVAVERYHAVLDPSKLVSAVQSVLQQSTSSFGSAGQGLQNLFSSLKFTSATADASVDGSGRLVTEDANIDLSFDLSLLGKSNAVTIQEEASAHFYDYGTAITIQPPGGG